jgi:hypothetical protein
MFSDDDFPPMADVLASRADGELQARHGHEEAKRELLPSAAECPGCGRESGDLDWFWFSSPPETWRGLCGRAGWMTFCDGCRRRVEFFLTIMN